MKAAACTGTNIFAKPPYIIENRPPLMINNYK